MISVFHGDVTRSNVGNHLGNKERIVFRAVFFVDGVISGFFLESVKTTDTGCYNHADTVAVYSFSVLEPAVLYSLTGCHKGILCIEVEGAEFLAVDVLGGVETLHFACKLGLEQRGVEVGDRSGTALSGFSGFPCGGHVIAERSNGTKAGHYYSF